jgi:hypothetical protein
MTSLTIGVAPLQTTRLVTKCRITCLAGGDLKDTLYT